MVGFYLNCAIAITVYTSGGSGGPRANIKLHIKQNGGDLSETRGLSHKYLNHGWLGFYMNIPEKGWFSAMLHL